jgi:DNA polymerase-3 subunit alpha
MCNQSNLEFDFFEIESIEEIKETEDVYDITVEDLHCFFANDILVHNCLAGIFSYELRKSQALGQSEEQILTTFENIVDRFDQIFNSDKAMPSRFYLEIQFNKLEIQHELNEYIVKLHRRTGIPLVAAADYHYPRRELFRARDLIKWVAHSRKYSDLTVRESIEELECELFPKNAHEMVEAYFEYDGKDYITEDELISSIKNAKFISDELIENFEIDTSPKLPKIGIGNTQKSLENMVIERFGKFIRAGKIPKDKVDIYMKRIDYELSTIKKKRFADYFLTYEIIMNSLREEMLVGAGRGSGAASIINWLLGITDIDPIRFDLKFERFLDEHRTQVYPKMDIF